MAAVDERCAELMLCLLPIENAFFIINTKPRQNNGRALFVAVYMLFFTISSAKSHNRNLTISPNIRCVSICYCASVTAITNTKHFWAIERIFHFSTPLKFWTVQANEKKNMKKNWLIYKCTLEFDWHLKAEKIACLLCTVSNTIHLFSIRIEHFYWK